ncbi:MAG: dUTP diphosphatase [Nanoarchaeota archaeon]|nr:dUTP diphosphatase [Nanoarchaeota archaeon]MBU1321756.1 dUTP diphosphatase [Nanoarchaeota archaeon]MBU1597480.1 dUTP diphosphatase [Nanoarchaeota archaeon]MBU2441418.1 dUTP diphosphatase [Nanoarchaeota archaeon]
MVSINIRRLPGNEDIPLPSYQTPGSAAFDLHAAVKEKIILKSGEYRVIPTGLQMAIPSGFVGKITPRSGLAAKHGISIVNSPGIIDSDYRGEVGVVLINLGKEDFVINRNDRIAQMHIASYERVDFEEVDELDSTDRGVGGFGSTGR